jgi:hypothetical protein
LSFFETIEKSHPDSALGVLGWALVHETRMLEGVAEITPVPKPTR